MTKHEASRTLVKSPPELWAELSDPTSLAGHLAEPFGEIRITRLNPETDVAWEGERASGTVRIESSGWGTRVTLTATAVEGESRTPEPEAPPPAAPVSRPPPSPPPAPTPAPAHGGRRLRMLGWLRGRHADEAERPLVWPPPADPEPAATAPPASRHTDPEPEARPDPDAALKRILDDLGAARHRPFSRS